MKTTTHLIRNQEDLNSLPKIDDTTNTFCLVFFGKSTVSNGLLDNFVSAIPSEIQIAGCSTSGEIFNHEVYDDCISVSFVKLEKSNFRIAYLESSEIEKSEDLGLKLGSSLLSEDLRGVFVLSDGINVNGTALANGLGKSFKTLKNNVTTSGGLAGDGSDFKETFTLVRTGGVTKLKNNQIVAIGFYGNSFKMFTSFRGGWNPYGKNHLITKSKGSVVFEIDHKPALSLYKEILGDLVKELPASALLYPLEVQMSSGAKNVRTILTINEAENSICFAGDMPEGSPFQVMRASFQELKNAAKASAESLESMSKDDMKGMDAIAIGVSCIGRKLLLGERIEDETDAVMQVLPEGVSFVGFYSYGELSPGISGNCELHNQTMTLTLFGERNG